MFKGEYEIQEATGLYQIKASIYRHMGPITKVCVVEMMFTTFGDVLCEISINILGERHVEAAHVYVDVIMD
jgi:hypothetical protein